ncbi:hypothetical protein [Streptomyces luteolus]|uniref:Uncharacterized protein n=1 Tax=Streptomyces luteolus TaxID=3043615 RepID=A0ABT6SWV0_9ACTN|nr:hypothetical protein [Streptomyces sp. B-S-A12]MDI3419695.1 hypothetical protein [Streptomyces sp. B-S-A12]
MSVRSRFFGRRRSAGSLAVERDAFAAEVRDELALDLPDEDLAEDPQDCLDFYRPGSKPRCEELEYLQMLREARDRIARHD